MFSRLGFIRKGSGNRDETGFLKVVSENYPLYEAVRIVEKENEPDAAETILQPGTVWADPELFRELDIRPGERVRAENGFFSMTQRIVMEPDRGISFIHFAPFIVMSLPHLKKRVGPTRIAHPVSSAF